VLDVFKRMFRSSSGGKAVPKISGKPVYILDSLYLGKAVRGRFNVKRKKIVELEVVDPWGLRTTVKTETYPVRIGRDRIVLDGVPPEILFEHRIRELTTRVEQIRNKLLEVDLNVEKLERALIDGSISEGTYMEYRRKYEERKDRLRKECEELANAINNTVEYLRKSLEDVAKIREALEVKVILGNASEDDARRRNELKRLADMLSSAADRLNLMKAQLYAIC